jgi:uncharacterized protein YecE (DUF72 family)
MTVSLTYQPLPSLPAPYRTKRFRSTHVHNRFDKDVYLYVNNDTGGHTVWNALTLREMLK